METVPENADQVAEKDEVIKEELERVEKQTAPAEIPAERSAKFRLAVSILLLLSLSALYFLLKTQEIIFTGSDRLLQWILGAIICVAIIAGSQVIKIYFIETSPTKFRGTTSKELSISFDYSRLASLSLPFYFPTGIRLSYRSV